MFLDSEVVVGNHDIEDCDVVSGGKVLGDVAADESRTAGDEDLHVQGVVGSML